MIDISRMTIAQSAKKLEGQPFLLYILQKRSGAESIVERAVKELADEVTVRFGLDNALEPKGVGNVSYRSMLL